MILTKDVRIAIDIIRYVRKVIVEEPKCITVDELAIVLNHSELHLHQIVRKLAKAGLVMIQRGPGGGIKDARDYISGYDVGEALGHFKPTKYDDNELYSRLLVTYIAYLV